MRVRFILGLFFICLQVGSVLYARFIPERFFCWAPYDHHTYFEVSVNINGELLSVDETKKRYRYKTHAWEQRSIYNIFSTISQYESTYGKNDFAEVEVIYKTNGHSAKTWTLNH